MRRDAAAPDEDYDDGRAQPLAVILTRVSSNRNQKLRDVAADVLRNLTGGEVRTHFDA